MTTLSKISNFEEMLSANVFKSVVISDMSVCLWMVYTACLLRFYYIDVTLFQGHAYFCDIDILYFLLNKYFSRKTTGWK